MRLKLCSMGMACLLACCIGSQAKGDLVIDVTGVAGSGVTTWNFSTVIAGSVSTAGSIRDNSANTFNAGDTGQFPFGQDTILDTSIQDQVLALTGNASVTVGGTTELITGIFLDDDGGSADDLGIRAANQIDYLVGESSSWTGSGTVNVDISAFVTQSWALSGQPMFFDGNTVINFTAIPEPGSALALLGVLGFVALRRRK